MDIFGDWGMVLRLIYGRTVGFHQAIILKL